MKILILNQAFYPDVVATAQMAADLAVHLVQRGHEVTVVAGRQGYDTPDARFPAQEIWRGVRIFRVASLNLGKKSPWRRALNFGSFLLGCCGRLMRLPRQDVVIALTSPPLISFLAAILVRWCGGRLISWIMDLNPDEAAAAGWLKEEGFVFRRLDALLRYSLRISSRVVVLDRFMRDRVARKGIPLERLAVIPPWPHEDQIAFDPEGRAAFRKQHGLEDAFVVMYSGNMSPLHPLDTLLAAAERLRDHARIRFVFAGGGSQKKQVQEFVRAHGLPNVLCLPYQPLEGLSASLSSADRQVVVMGPPFVGIIHPCKIYNILTLGLPFLYIGPEVSHAADILARLPPGSSGSFLHGDVEGVVDYLVRAAEAQVQPPHERLLAAEFAQAVQLGAMTALVEGLA